MASPFFLSLCLLMAYKGYQGNTPLALLLSLDNPFGYFILRCADHHRDPTILRTTGTVSITGNGVLFPHPTGG